ncbi:MAG: 4-hydroxy-tetrahydrodipicolinate synthase [Oscillospiraceae bacterium]|nr:4-hydroxy-tetrahydrodipicolinate synthase [Oscillospiraceae bacterium]
MKQPIFRGAGVAIITPMHPDGSIHYEELGKLIDDQIQRGTDAIVICGTTGESACMTDQEHVDCIAYAVKRVNKRVPVVAGAGSNDTAYACELSREAQRLGADALLQVTPYYNKTSQRGLIAHFTKIADASELPVILYSVASRTGVNILPETCKILSEHPRIAAIKEASGNISQIAQIRALCGDALQVYSGNDDQIVPILSLGGAGVISVLSNVMPQETHDICQKFFDGDITGAAALQLRLLELTNALFMDVNPVPVKAAMNLLGWNAGPCRLPLVDLTSEQTERLRAVMSRAGLSV